MRQETVFSLVHRNAEPIARANRRLDLEQQLAADGKQASADAADAPCPIFGNLVELERRIVDQRLNGSDYTIIRISHSHAAAYRSDARFGKTGGQLPDCIGMKDTV